MGQTQGDSPMRPTDTQLLQEADPQRQGAHGGAGAGAGAGVGVGASGGTERLCGKMGHPGEDGGSSSTTV